MNVIGIGHKARMGKDTAGKLLARRYGFEIFHWADDLYEECRDARIVLEVKDERQKRLHINGVCYRDHALIDTVHNWIRSAPGHNVNHKDKSGSFVYYYDGMVEKDAPLLQWWGTDFRRKFEGEDYWVKKTERRILSSGANLVVIPDTRFPNEAQYVKDMGGQVWRVWSKAPMEDTGRPDTHPSETALDHWDFDRDLENVKERLYLLDMQLKAYAEIFLLDRGLA